MSVPKSKRDECPVTFIQPTVSAKGAPAFRVEDTGNFVIGRGVGRNAGVKGNEHQRTFARGVASADCALAPRRPLLAPNKVETTKSFVVGRVSIRTAGVRINERQGTFVRAAAGADVAPACHRPWPALNDGETTKKPVVGRVPARGNGIGGNECWRTFVQAIASAERAPAPRCPSLALENVELTMKELVVGRLGVRARGTDDRKNERQETFVHVVAGATGAPARCRPPRKSNSIEKC
jgi:hypothetical protein